MSAVADHIDLDDLDEVWAREYLRVSHDKSGRLRSPEEQHDDHVAELVRRPTWRLGDPYEDEGSASRYAKKRRANYDRLIADLEADRFGAQILILWEASRGTREVWEMARLLRLCELRGVHVFITTHRRLYDPRVTRDWRTLMEEALDAETEVRKTSERTRRASKADADFGRFSGGRRPYGYAANGVDIVPEERDVIVDAVRAVLDGVPVRRIAADLNERGILTSAGNKWHPGPLAKLLASERIVGKRVHHGVVVKHNAWPRIIDEITHKRVVAVLKSRSPIGRRGRTPWLLTGLLHCGRDDCGALLVGQTDTRGTRRYICRRGPGQVGCGGLVIKAEPLEEILAVLVTDRLRNTEARIAAELGPDDQAELVELDAITALRAEINEDRANGEIASVDAKAQLAALVRRQRAVDARLAAKVRETRRLGLIDTKAYVGRPWVDLDPTEQRIVLDAMIERVRVGPASLRGSTMFETARVTAPKHIEWRV